KKVGGKKTGASKGGPCSHSIGLPSGGRLGAFDGPELRRIDGNATGLLFLGHNALEVDMEQAVLKPRRLDLDMFGKLEAALKSAAGDALMEQRGGRLIGLFALAGNG